MLGNIDRTLGMEKRNKVYKLFEEQLRQFLTEQLTIITLAPF